MIHKEINLIPNKKAISPQEAALRRRLSVGMPLLLVGYLVILGAVFGYWLLLIQNNKQIDTDLNTEKRLISERTNDEGIYSLLKQKALALTKIFGHRTDFNALYSYFTEVAGDQIVIKSVLLTDSRNITLEVEAVDSFAVDAFVAKLLQDGPNHFQRIELANVHLAVGGRYTISLDIDAQQANVL